MIKSNRVSPGTYALSIIIPTLNEEANLPILVKRIDASLNRAGIKYEIIVVDDNSSDNTLKVSQYLENIYELKTFTKHGKTGKAYSILEGFELASSDVVCMIDGDLQYPPEEIVNMYKLMEHSKVDIVITERVDMRKSFTRKLSTKVFNSIFAKGLFGIDYDTQSGLKLFKKQVLNEITVSPSPWSFDLEFIVRSLEAGFSIVSHKIPFYERTYGKPKLKVIQTTYELSIASIKLRKAISLPLIKNAYKKNVKHVQSLIVSLLIISSSVVMGSLYKPSDAAALSLTDVANSQSQNLSNLENQINSLSGNQTSGNSNSSSVSTSSDGSSTNTAQTPLASSVQDSKDSSNSSQVSSSQNYQPQIAATKTSSGSAIAPFNPVETKTGSNGIYYKNNKLSSKQTNLLDTISEILLGVALLMFILASRAKYIVQLFKKSKSYKLIS